MNDQEKFIDEVVQELLDTWVSRRRDKLSRFKDTGLLYNTLAAEAHGLVNQALTYGVKFPDSGRILDMRRQPAKGIGREQIEALKKWAERNLGSLRGRMERKYEKEGRKSYTDQRIINDVAWGIAKARTQKGGRRRQWYNKPKGAMLAALYDHVAEAMLDTTAEELFNDLQNRKR